MLHAHPAAVALKRSFQTYLPFRPLAPVVTGPQALAEQARKQMRPVERAPALEWGAPAFENGHAMPSEFLNLCFLAREPETIPALQKGKEEEQ